MQNVIVTHELCLPQTARPAEGAWEMPHSLVPMQNICPVSAVSTLENLCKPSRALTRSENLRLCNNKELITCQGTVTRACPVGTIGSMSCCQGITEQLHRWLPRGTTAAAVATAVLQPVA